MKIINLAEVDSTNEEAKRLFLTGKINEPSCLVAKCQSAGKGSQGRTWLSPAGGLYLSIIHPSQNNDIPMTTLFTLSAGVACVEAIKENCNLKIQLKPINDLIFEGQKLGGILTETLIQKGQIRALITGIGINLKAVPNNLDIPITSLQELLPPHQYERFLADELIQGISQKTEHWHEKVFNNNFRAVESAWKSYQVPDSIMPQGC